MPVIKGQPHPAAGRRLPPDPLTPAEVAAILGGCSMRAPTGVRNRAMITLMYRSGLRISEALSLKPANIRLDDCSARVLHGKGDKATVRYFHPSAADALARWLDVRKTLGLKNGTLFCTLEGAPLSDRYVRDLLRRLADKAGIDKRVHPHGLRHTFADELRRGGADVVQISKLLGHSSIAVTARYLDHLTNAGAGEALRAIDLPELPDVAPAPRKRRAAASHGEPQQAVPMPEARSAATSPPAVFLEPPAPQSAPCAHPREFWSEERGTMFCPDWKAERDAD